jgi:hypothetical protein
LLLPWIMGVFRSHFATFILTLLKFVFVLFQTLFMGEWIYDWTAVWLVPLAFSSCCLTCVLRSVITDNCYIGEQFVLFLKARRVDRVHDWAQKLLLNWRKQTCSFTCSGPLCAGCCLPCHLVVGLIFMMQFKGALLWTRYEHQGHIKCWQFIGHVTDCRLYTRRTLVEAVSSYLLIL